MKFLPSIKNELIFIAISVVGLLIFIKCTGELSFTYDSWGYIEASKSLKTYFLEKNTDNHTYLYRPPALPFYLHFFQNKILGAKLLNATCYILSLWLCYYIGRQFKFEPPFLILFVVLVAVSYPWVQNHFFLWSEPLFGTGILLLVWILIEQKSWVPITIVCIMLFFIRKAGVFITAATFIVYLLNREYRKAIWISVVSVLVFVFWELLTFHYSGISPPQNVFLYLVDQSRWHYADVITAWFIPRNVTLIAREFIFCASIIFLFYYFKNNLYQLFLLQEFKTVVILVGVYFLFFLLFLGASEYIEAERYLSVVMPLCMLILVAIVNSIYLQFGRGTYVLIIFILWMVYPVSRLIYHLL